MNVYEEVQKNISEWERFIKENVGSSAILISASAYDSNRRIYKNGNRIIKIHKNSNRSKDRANNLKEEYDILKIVSTVRGICKNPSYDKQNEWEMLSYDYIEGTSLENLLITKGFTLHPEIFKKTFKIIAELNKKGIAHRDIKPGNILLDKDNNVYIIDFDQAIRIPALSALLIDLVGIGNQNKRGFFSYQDLIEKHYTQKPFWIKYISFIVKILRRLQSTKKFSSAAATKQSNDTEIAYLQEAWHIAEHAGANSPGNQVAYYSLDIQDVHLPGERSWMLRWANIYGKIDFKDRKILECGCNLGLLSAFAKNAGAQQCVGVDINQEILNGSRLVSKALHADNEFIRIDFDSNEHWEEQLRGFDMVTAFSVVNWLEDKERFLSFLGTHNEVLYEGHDSIAVETERLKKAGFKNVTLLFMSERNRAIFHGHK
jgi:serine/threonine protein kinase